MYNYFVLRGSRAILREWAAGWVAVTVGAILFGIVFANFSLHGEEVGFVAALVLSVPVSLVLLQAVRTGRLRLPDVTIPRGVPAWTKEESEGYGKFWESLDPEARRGLQWVTGMIAANALFEPMGRPLLPPPRDLNDDVIEGFEEKVIEDGKREVRFKLKGKEDQIVVLTWDHNRHIASYSLGRQEEAGER